jgi:molybdenum cofactor synthesis domain-containing protein
MTDTSAASSAKTYSACLVIIGNEILSGRTQDANLAFLAKALNDIGVQMTEARVIPDIEDTIVAVVNEVRAKHDYVFTTGGIGPTHDDITAQSVAKAFGVPLVLDAEAKRRLEARHTNNLPLNEARLRMAHVPEGATLIDNPISAAPGFQIGNVFVLAGVPAIARAMFDGLGPRLAGGARIETRSITCNLAEGAIAHDLTAIQARWPSLSIGSYPVWRSEAGFAVSLVLRGPEKAELETAGSAVIAMIADHGGIVIEEAWS